MPEITKRKVTMLKSVAAGVDEDGNILTHTHAAVDYIRPDFLEAYVTDARTRWDAVIVADEPDAGPAGYHGETYVPANLAHPLAGETFAATTPED